MKDFILKSKVLLFILILGTAFSCGKEKVKTIINDEPKSVTKNTISERSECCGSVKIFMRTGQILPYEFQAWYLDNTGIWKSTPCVPKGTYSITINACTNEGSPLIVVLTPCGGTNPGTPLPPNGDIVMSSIDACGKYHFDPQAPCWSFAYGTVLLPVPLPGYGSTYYGPSQETSLCCY